MKSLKVLLVVTFSTILGGMAWSQNANVGSGYLNPGVNSTMPIFLRASPNAASLSVATGKIVTNFTITVTSAIPSTVPISCNVSASVNDASSTTFTVSNIVTDAATVVATRSAATKASCTVTIPYSWNLYNRTTDGVRVIYSISSGTNSAAAGQLQNRTSSQFLATISVPANGATTTETVTATM